MKPAQSRGLGKGLSALFTEEYSDKASAAPVVAAQPVPVGFPHELPVTQIVSGKFQPRVRFTEDQLNELAASIAKNGVMQPIVVRPHPELAGKYEIIAGERRWRASQKAGLTQVPAIVRELGDQQALELALIENVQRQDLTPVEEALGYQRLIDEFSYSHDELSATVGKSRSHISNLIRLLSLPKEIKEMLDDGRLTMGHARAILKAEKPVEMAEEVIRRGLNVRQTENLARGGLPVLVRKPRADAANQNAGASEPATTTATTTTVVTEAAMPTSMPKDPDILALEETLSESLGMVVSINCHGQKGQIVLAYDSLEQLDTILQRLGGM